MSLPIVQPSFSDTTDHTNSARAFIAGLDPCTIRSSDGRIVWNHEEYNFLDAECPPTVNPKLWRQGQMGAKQGLFEVSPGIYQARNLDLANISFIEGNEGVIIIDPLISVECAEAALGLYRKHRGPRPVKAVIYSHSHVDHFAGANAVLPPPNAKGEYDIPIIAPEGFMEEALGENVFAGPAMRRRAVFMYGASLPKGPKGQVGCGLAMATSRGTTSLIPPNDLIHTTGEERTIDGVRFVFQMVPETEAPSEVNFFLPDRQALYIAECATQGMHNIITLRGALVRDAKRWAKYLDETLALYGTESSVLFAGHGWPTWETQKIISFVSDQRDLYAYMHDQTVRLMNLGLNGTEIAEQLRLPPALQEKWPLQGFYGSLSHNVKGIYQRYMTWFDGNPANLWKHTRVEEGKRYVDCMGGVDAVIEKAREYAGDGDLRFAATLLDHVVAAEPANEAARKELADVYERLGFGAENATWRNFYLTGAQELRQEPKTKTAGPQQGSRSLSSINPQSSVGDWLDGMSVQLDGPRACMPPRSFVIYIYVSDEGTGYLVRLSNGTLSHRTSSEGAREPGEQNSCDMQVSLRKNELYGLLSSGDLSIAADKAKGEMVKLAVLLDLCGIRASGTEPNSRL